MNLIDVDELKKNSYTGTIDKWEYGPVVDLSDIENAPIIPAEPIVYADWINKEDIRGVDIRCSACDESIYESVALVYEYHLPKRCPNCGAHMRGERRE